MPLYRHKCRKCAHIFEKISPWAKSRFVRCPKCKGRTIKLITCPGVLITDTNFAYTGTIDRRLGGRPVEGRRDWERRMKEKGLVPLSQADLKAQDDMEPVMQPIPEF